MRVLLPLVSPLLVISHDIAVNNSSYRKLRRLLLLESVLVVGEISRLGYIVFNIKGSTDIGY